MKHKKDKKINKRKTSFKYENETEKIMLGNFNESLDKQTCFLSLAAISLFIILIATSDLYRVFNISGIFKQ